MKSIEPKPTTYADILFASRLEAQWAVLLDAYCLCTGWIYQPFTFTFEEEGWEYVPDFLVNTALCSFIIEVKPILPEQDYLRNLCLVAGAAGKNGYAFKLGYGNFFRSIPKIASVDVRQAKHKTIRLSSKKLNESQEFPRIQPALDILRKTRFDLPLKRLR